MSVPDWAKELPADLQGHEFVKATPDLPTLVKRFADLDTYRGRSIALPKDGDADSAKAFAEAVGKRGFIAGEVPGDAAGYGLAADVDGLDLAPDWLQTKAAEYHAAGLTKAQAARAVERDLGALRSTKETLAKEFGAAGLALIDRAAQKHGINGDPMAVYRLLRELGANMSEDSTKVGGGVPASKTLQQVEAELTELDEQILKLPTYDARRGELMNRKVSLLGEKIAISSGDANARKLTLEDMQKRVLARN
jgi:hypothetical protein